MESEVSLPCSKEPTIGPYLEPDESHPHNFLSFIQDILLLLLFYPSNCSLPYFHFHVKLRGLPSQYSILTVCHPPLIPL